MQRSLMIWKDKLGRTYLDEASAGIQLEDGEFIKEAEPTPERSQLRVFGEIEAVEFREPELRVITATAITVTTARLQIEATKRE